MTISTFGLKRPVTYAKISPKLVNLRDIAGDEEGGGGGGGEEEEEVEEEEEEEDLYTQKSHQNW